MVRVRSFLWLLALIAFVMPPLGMATASHAMPPMEQMAGMDCHDHAPPPKECPDKGTAKHSAGQCCPSMAVGDALPPLPSAGRVQLPVHLDLPERARLMTGVALTKDPPPPRA
ncbi:hypothetical protein [Reyranella aquatilis]|uniref:CopL family metal-binding regulatory protein n=1 Tax=Reyranella aquatilis TaxID=2035356 RepID=A0ABS8KXM9_9HYPH|nr:hypothetical protein [Reyranella aquatilis]MCC8430853.1 hypothetical protein [Reyranella aquatilis]